MGAARAVLLSPTALKSLPASKNALIVGAGVSGMESALALSTKRIFRYTLLKKRMNWADIAVT